MTIQPAKSYRVMVVDDNDGDRELIQEAIAIASLPIELIPFHQAQQVLHYFSQGNAVDLLLVDLNMPSMGGAELVSRLLTDPRLATIPIVVMSNSALSLAMGHFDGQLMVPSFTKPSTWKGYQFLAREIHACLQQLDGSASPRGIGVRLAERMRTPTP